MKKNFFYLLTVSFCVTSVFLQGARAQNTSPFWSLAGNNNAGAGSKLGTTNAVPLRLFTNNSERIRIEPSNGNVGINNTTPIGRLTVQNNGTTPSGAWITAGQPLFAGFGEGTAGSADYVLSMASNSAVRSVLIGRRSRGTLAAPTVVQNNDFLFSFLASGHDGSSFQNPATIDIFVDGVPSNGNVPARISFVTGSNIGNRQERLKIGNTGNITFNDNQMFLRNSDNFVGVGTTTPEATLHVVKGDAAGAVGFVNAPLVVENTTHSYVNILAPDANETGILFGKPASNVSGGIIYNNASTINGLQFRTHNNVNRMVLDANGNLGVGTLSTGGFRTKVSHGSFGLDIESAQNLNDWELVTFTNLSLFFNGGFMGSFSSTNGAYTAASDERLKTNIKPMSTMLEKIKKLKPSTYQFKNTTDKQEHHGFIAQDVMKIFPSMVVHNVDAERKLDAYTMDYSGFGVIAVKGIQELVPVIEEQNIKIATLEDRIVKLEAALAALAGKTPLTSMVNDAGLGQNSPNPVRNSTRISYNVPAGAAKAQLHITDNLGKTLQVTQLDRSGNINLNISSLSSGIYNYSLVVDGKTVSTKKMTVVRN